MNIDKDVELKIHPENLKLSDGDGKFLLIEITSEKGIVIVLLFGSALYAHKEILSEFIIKNKYQQNEIKCGGGGHYYYFELENIKYFTFSGDSLDYGEADKQLACKIMMSKFPDFQYEVKNSA